MIILALLLLALAACGSDSVMRACTANYAYGLFISVTDAATGAPVEGVAAEIRDGSWVDTHVTVLGNTVMGAGERPGVYAITIRKDGYADWTRSGVAVTMTPDRCHVQGVHLDAALVRRPLVLFHEVDVTVVVERAIGGRFDPARRRSTPASGRGCSPCSSACPAGCAIVHRLHELMTQADGLAEL